MTPELLSPPRHDRLLVVLFLAAVVAHVWLVTHNWTVGFMSGHEFRQAQTALTSYYIDQQNNFGLLYETPVLGKPWVSILMEVPIYEWAVVGLSRLTGSEHVVAARTVTLACFYLTIPAFYLLLGRLALPRSRRLLVLSLVLVCPAYIYYSRAFLIDSMALMGTAWFLVGFLRTQDERRGSWLMVATVAGTLAALVKSAIFAVWLPAAAGYAAWLLWRDYRSRAGIGAMARTAGWACAAVAVPLLALRAWIAYTDPLKAAHASAWIFTSKTLTQGNWGLFDFRAIFARETWRLWLGCWEQAIASRWIVAAGLLLGLALPSVRWRVLLLGGWFFLAQFLFPFAYAYQDYYYYSCAVFVLAALGCTLSGLLESRLPRWAVLALVAVPLAGEVAAYWRGYRRDQSVIFSGDLPFTTVLRELTPRNSVLVVAGADWAAMTPYYAQRRALMVRNGLEFDLAYLRRAFKDLGDEDISALVLMGDVRTNATFIRTAASRFDIDARHPTFSSSAVDVYVARPYVRQVREGLRDRDRYPELTVFAGAAEDPHAGAQPVTATQAREIFAGVSPAPQEMKFQFGAGRQGRGESSVILANPDSDVWIVPPADARSITWGFGIFPAAHARPEASTDGVEFLVVGELPNGRLRRIYRRVLEPQREPADRGDQTVTIPYRPLPGEVLRFATRPYDNSAYDWSYWLGIEVK